MTTKLLLPNKYKMIGWCILIPATIVGIILTVKGFDALPITTKVFAVASDADSHGAWPSLGGQYFSFIHSNITATITGVLFIAGALLVGFSREKTEDEFIANLRLGSLLWAVFVNYTLLILAFLFVYGWPFFNVMVYNMFTVLLLFVMRFNYVLYRNSKMLTDEK